MPLETASFIHQLDAANPLGSDPIASGDDHLRLIKAAVKATFPNIAGAVNVTHTDLNDKVPNSLQTTGGTMTGALVLSGAPTASLQAATKGYVDASFPVGGIIMWSGSIASIPSGWALCNGTNGTPDLRDRFVVGAGSTYAVGATGGSANAIVVAHSHAISSTAASGGTHQHFVVTNGTHGGEGGLSTTTYIGRRSAWNSDFSYDFATASSEANIGLTSNAGAHTHSITSTASTEGSSGINANLPPYYALAYIMKV